MMHSQTNISLTFAMNVVVHSKQAQSIWEELGKDVEMEDSVEIAQVDCTTSKATCTNVGIRSYPTLKLFYDGEDHKTFKGSICHRYYCRVSSVNILEGKHRSLTIKHDIDIANMCFIFPTIKLSAFIMHAACISVNKVLPLLTSQIFRF